MLKSDARLGIMLLISLALSLAAIMQLLLHDLGIEAGQIFQAMLAALDSSTADPDSHAAFILWEMRVPRVLVGAGCGAALGVAGAMVQSITRNPLGSPDLMGVSAGAALMMIVGFLFADTTPLGLLALGTLGGFVAGAMTFMMVWRTRLDPLFLTLSGMSVAIFCSAGIMLLLVGAANEANGLYFWLIGSLDDRGWRHVLMLYPWLLLGLPLGLLLGRRLDMLLLGEDVCHGLGLNVLWWRAGLGLLVVILTAATVAVSGPIAFVGLVVPHIVRQCLGRHIAHQLLLPCSAMVGATLMLVADAIAHAAGIPVGIMAIVIGAPVLLKLIHRQVQ